MPKSSELKSLWELIKPIKFGMLSTHHKGRIHARPMSLIQDEFNGRLYFFTQDDSLKVTEVTDEQEVGVSFSSPEDQVYVSLSGDARISRNRELIERFWSPMVQAYFPKGKDDPHLALMEIDVDSAECWDADKSAMVQMFELAKSFFTNKRPDLGEHRQYE